MIICDIVDTDVVIIPEQHLYYKPIVTVPEMIKDNQNIINNILDLLKILNNPTVIFIGDIVHQGIKNTEDSYFIHDFFRLVYHFTNGKVYSVVGNHEISYRKNNPFWGVADIKSDYVNNIIRHSYNVEQPLLTVVDDMIIGDMQYSFGHYGRKYSYCYKPDDNAKYVTLLSHNSLLTKEISDYMHDKNIDLKEQYVNIMDLRNLGSIPNTPLLKFVYVGHMHLAHGIFEVEENINDVPYNFTLHYLASLGRTSHLEYTNDLERNIPIHAIRNGKFVDEKFHKIILPPRELSVDERVVLENKESYDRLRQHRKLKKINTTTVDLIKDIQNYLVDNENPSISDLFARSANNELDIDILNLLNKYL